MDDSTGDAEQVPSREPVGHNRIGALLMNPWFAAMIPLAIILVLGSIAFFIGIKGYWSNDRYDLDQEAVPTPKQGDLAVRVSTDTDRTDRATQQDALRDAIAGTDRLVSRASYERAVLVQYIDLHAPGTVAVQEFLSNLRTDYSRRVTFVARHLPTNDQARLGATALEAADRQDCFLPFLEAITLGPDAQELPRLNQPITIDTYLAVARDLGLDSERFEADMLSSEVHSQIEADRREAALVGVMRAPALILLDDQSHSALTSLEDFREAVRLVTS